MSNKSLTERILSNVDLDKFLNNKNYFKEFCGKFSLKPINGNEESVDFIKLNEDRDGLSIKLYTAKRIYTMHMTLGDSKLHHNIPPQSNITANYLARIANRFIIIFKSRFPEDELSHNLGHVNDNNFM